MNKPHLPAFLPILFLLPAYSALVVTDGSFENFTPDAIDGTNNRVVLDDWFEEAHGTDGGGTGDESSEQALAEGGNRPDTDFGGFWGNLQNKDNSSFGAPAIYQNLGTWSTGNQLQYNLSMVLGDRSNQPTMALTLEFFSVDAGDAGTGADGTTLASAFTTETLLDFAVTPDLDPTSPSATENGVTSTFLYSQDFTFSPANVSDGDSIWLRISGVNSQTGNNNQEHILFDNVTVTAIPEPSSLALAGMALCSALLMLRRQKNG